MARHPERPHCLDYIGGLITEFVPLAGDRAFAEDAAVVGGIGRFRGRSVLALGTEKGADTPSAACAIISAWRGPKAIARRVG